MHYCNVTQISTVMELCGLTRVIHINVMCSGVRRNDDTEFKIINVFL
jgi:hypothetical protein